LIDVEATRMKTMRYAAGLAILVGILASGGAAETAHGQWVARSKGAKPASDLTVIDANTVRRGGETWRIVGLVAPGIHGAQCEAERAHGIRAAARLVELFEYKGARLVGENREQIRRRQARLIIGWPSTGENDWAAIAIQEGLGVAWDGSSERPHDWCAESAEVKSN
jgi:hypothetical protein